MHSVVDEFWALNESTVSSIRKREDISLLLRPGGIGVELGVAEGRFSEKLLSNSQLSFLYSIDMWSGDRGHDVEEYKVALRRLLSFKERNSLLRMTFSEALDLFPDDYFDFIYVDGYAHTGQEDGQTFEDWWPKCRSGGVFAGDDYHPDFPLVIQTVDAFVESKKLRFCLLDKMEKGDDWASQYPTWFVIKP